MNVFFVVLARNRDYVQEKMERFEDHDVPYCVIRVEKMDHSKIVHREPKGKWDAVNSSRKVIPKNTDVVGFQRCGY